MSASVAAVLAHLRAPDALDDQTGACCASCAQGGACESERRDVAGGKQGPINARNLRMYMRQVDLDITHLHRDIVDRPAPQLGQSFWGHWMSFTESWGKHYRDHYPVALAILNTEAGWAGTLKHEAELAKFYERYSKGGGRPTRPKPQIGFEAPPETDWTSLAAGGLFVAALFGGGYLLSQANRMRG